MSSVNCQDRAEKPDNQGHLQYNIHNPCHLGAVLLFAGIPVASTLMGLGSFPQDDPLALHMLGMHGTVYANYAVDQADLLIALGVRFDDRVTGKLEAFATRARIVHIDIDPAGGCCVSWLRQPPDRVVGRLFIALVESFCSKA